MDSGSQSPVKGSGSSRRRRMPRVPSPVDEFEWLKYGEKILVCPVRTRAYFKCSKTSSGCRAKKSVDYSNPDPTAAPPVVRYSNDHNHGPLSPAAEGERDACTSGIEAWGPPPPGGGVGREQEGGSAEGVFRGDSCSGAIGAQATADRSGAPDLGSSALPLPAGNSLLPPAGGATGPAAAKAGSRVPGVDASAEGQSRDAEGCLGERGAHSKGHVAEGHVAKGEGFHPIPQSQPPSIPSPADALPAATRGEALGVAPAPSGYPRLSPPPCLLPPRGHSHQPAHTHALTQGAASCYASCPSQQPVPQTAPQHTPFTSHAPTHNLSPIPPTSSHPMPVLLPQGRMRHVAETTSLQLPRGPVVHPPAATPGHTAWHCPPSLPGPAEGHGMAHVHMAHPSSYSTLPVLHAAQQPQALLCAPPQHRFQDAPNPHTAGSEQRFMDAPNQHTAGIGARRLGPGGSEQPPKVARVTLQQTPSSSSSGGSTEHLCCASGAPEVRGGGSMGAPSPWGGPPPLLARHEEQHTSAPPQSHASSAPLNLSKLAGQGSGPGPGMVWDEGGGLRWPGSSDHLWHVPLPEDSLDLFQQGGEASLNLQDNAVAPSSHGGMQPCWEMGGLTDGQVNGQVNGQFLMQEHGVGKDVAGAGFFLGGSVGGLASGSMQVHREVFPSDPNMLGYEAPQWRGGATAVLGRGGDTKPFQVLPAFNKAPSSTSAGQKEGAEKLPPSDSRASLAMISELAM